MADLVSVTSAAIDRIEWDEDSEDMFILMKDGSRLVYGEVPQGVYEDFLGAGSKGAFFNYEIRNRYPFHYG